MPKNLPRFDPLPTGDFQSVENSRRTRAFGGQPK
jgi:hypothetical protein